VIGEDGPPKRSVIMYDSIEFDDYLGNIGLTVAPTARAALYEGTYRLLLNFALEAKGDIIIF